MHCVLRVGFGDQIPSMNNRLYYLIQHDNNSVANFILNVCFSIAGFDIDIRSNGIFLEKVYTQQQQSTAAPQSKQVARYSIGE